MRTFAKELFLGLGQLANVWPAVKVQGYPHRDELEALRSDTKRVGDDMRRVIGRF